MTKLEAYRVFGLSINQPVTLEQIKNRYRILTKTYHPDNPRTGSAEMMARINIAFDALRTFNFDPENDTANQPFPNTRRETKDDFNPDFTPFEYGSRDESFYHNPNYRGREENSGGYKQYERYYEESSFEHDYEQTFDEEEEEEEVRLKKRHKKKKRGGIFILLRFIGRIIKLFIICGFLGFLACAPLSVYLFGMNKRGLFLAGASIVLAMLSVLVFKYFNELTK